MNQRPHYSRILLFTLGLAVVALAGFTGGRQLLTDVPTAVALERPAFLDDASQTDLVGEKVQDEAGIAAYYKAPNQLNLELIRPLFNSIELESADYILGSISVPNYDQHYDVHIYVRRDGWILAYYLASAPTSKMIDTRALSLNNTKLTIAMNNVAVTGGAPFGAVTYYNFNYPNATHMLLVGEAGEDESFQITIPSSYSYYEISCAGNNNPVRIDSGYCGGSYSYESVPITAFLPDVTHTVTAWERTYASEYAGLAIIYRMP